MTAREPSDAEVEAAFNDIVARLTGRDELDDSWADQHPLFADPEETENDGPVLRGEVLDPVPDDDPAGEDGDADRDGPLGWRTHTPPDDEDLDDIDLDELPRTPLPPWRPPPVTIAALVLVGAAVVVTVLLMGQVRLPGWVGWAALVGFLTGMGLLFSRLPRDRDDDSDDGAMV